MLGKLVETFANNDTSTCEARAIQVLMVMVMVMVMVLVMVMAMVIKKVPQAVDWYVAPLLNPDGYEYSHTNDRMWRKNRFLKKDNNFYEFSKANLQIRRRSMLRSQKQLFLEKRKSFQGK